MVEEMNRDWAPIDSYLTHHNGLIYREMYDGSQAFEAIIDDAPPGYRSRGATYDESDFMNHRAQYWPGQRPGDWICPCCYNTNWEWRMQCNRCHTCKDLEMVANVPVEAIVRHRMKKRLSTHPAGVFKDNDWVCIGCGNINWDWRIKCHQCGTGKPTISTAATSVNSSQILGVAKSS
jgi:hypothetical protein